MVQDLRAQLTHPEAIYDAMTILRTLITEITLQSQPQGCALTITGALGPIIHQTAQTQKAPRRELVSETAVLLVAGAHNIQCRTFVLLARGKSKKPGIGMISRAQPSAAYVKIQL